MIAFISNLVTLSNPLTESISAYAKLIQQTGIFLLACSHFRRNIRKCPKPITNYSFRWMGLTLYPSLCSRELSCTFHFQNGDFQYISSAEVLSTLLTYSQHTNRRQTAVSTQYVRVGMRSRGGFFLCLIHQAM